MASSILSKYRSDLANAITDPDSIGVMLCKRGVREMASSILSKYRSDLANAINDPDSIAMELFSRGVISHHDMTRVTSEDDVHVQTELLLNLMEFEVKKNKDSFHEFLHVLKKAGLEKVSSSMELDLRSSWSGLTMSDLLMLLEELHWLSSKWYMLGIQLRLSPDALDNIRRQSSDPGDCLRETLIVWLKTTPNPTWKMVIDALRRRSLGEHRLAFSLEAKYGSTAATATAGGSTVHSKPEDKKDAAEHLIGERPTMVELIRFPGVQKFSIPERICPHYHIIGILLLEDETGAVVDGIVKENRGYPMEITLVILKKWLQDQGQQPVTWGTLVDVLRDANMSVLANDIETQLKRK